MESVKRGYIPNDIAEFGPGAEGKLKAACTDLCFLLNRGYPVKAASTFVGNHHLLSERQRLALARITSADSAIAARWRTRLTQTPPELVLDGFNTIITLEGALSGSLLIEGMDGTIRDMAGLRGTYRIVDKTIRAVELHPAVDKQLYDLDNVVTSDAVILDHCKSWYNLNRSIIEQEIPDAWILRL